MAPADENEYKHCKKCPHHLVCAADRLRMTHRCYLCDKLKIWVPEDPPPPRPDWIKCNSFRQHPAVRSTFCPRCWILELAKQEKERLDYLGERDNDL